MPSFLSNKERYVFSQYQKYFEKELSFIYSYIHKKLSIHKSLNSYEANNLSKFVQLSEAKKCGLKIPNTI